MSLLGAARYTYSKIVSDTHMITRTTNILYPDHRSLILLHTPFSCVLRAPRSQFRAQRVAQLAVERFKALRLQPFPSIEPTGYIENDVHNLNKLTYQVSHANIPFTRGFTASRLGTRARARSRPWNRTRRWLTEDGACIPH